MKLIEIKKKTIVLSIINRIESLSNRLLSLEREVVNKKTEWRKLQFKDENGWKQEGVKRRGRQVIRSYICQVGVYDANIKKI